MSELRLREDYEVQRLLGTGGFGAVFSAKNLSDNKCYALKVILDISGDDDRSSSEIETFKRLPPHQNIVKYYKSWNENASKVDMTQLIEEFKITSKRFKAILQAPDNIRIPITCIEMELCEGDLRKWIQDNSKNKNFMKLRGTVILQIAEGIQHLHDNKILHRDLKPDNIFLINCGSDSSDYIVKIGDFGISKKHQGTRMADHTAKIGTVAYLAPEMTGSNYGRKIDWYSLGLIIFEMFFPEMQPEDGDTFGELFSYFTQLKYDRKLPSKLRFAWPRVANVILRLTEVSVDNRGDFNDVKQAFGSMKPAIAHPIGNQGAQGPVKVLPVLVPEPVTVPEPVPVPRPVPEPVPRLVPEPVLRLVPEPVSRLVPEPVPRLVPELVPVPEPKPKIEQSKHKLLKGEFAIKKLLGTGSFGAVFKVRNKNTNKSYAIKLFAQNNDMEECLKEVKNYEQIRSHENVVAYKGSWEEKMSTRDVEDILKKFKINNERFKSLFNIGEQDHANFLCIQMELCAEDLRAWLKANMTVNEENCRDIFSQVAEGTQHLHNSNLIHRDLKPDNIFLKRGGVVKIGDLGISKKHTSTNSAQHTANFGTMMYLAPEMQCAQYGKMVDWWASGLILFELFHPEMQMSNSSNQFENVIKGFNELKFQRKLPEVVSRNWPVVADLILKLTDSNSINRGGYKEIREFFKKFEKPPPPPRHEFLRGASSFISSDYNVSENNSNLDNVICGICKKEILGIRFKCSICINFDLCEKCEKKKNVHSKEHALLKITSTHVESKALENVIDDFAKGLTRVKARVVTLSKSYVHVKCNQCKGTVERDLSYKCLDCEDFNFCQKCHKKHTKTKSHFEDHVFVLMYLEMECKHCNRICDRFSAYQCMRCEKFDLCSDCYIREKNLHCEHRFVKFQDAFSQEESNDQPENIYTRPVM